MLKLLHKMAHYDVASRIKQINSSKLFPWRCWCDILRSRYHRLQQPTRQIHHTDSLKVGVV